MPQVFIQSEDDLFYLQEDLGDTLLFNAIEKGRTYGLPEEFVKAVFTAIHDASVNAQNEILSDKNGERS